MTFFKEVALIVKKDLQTEFRQKSLLLSMLVFAILIQVMLIMSFDADQKAMKAIAPGLLWIPILLAAMIGFSKYGSTEKENDAITGLLLSPIDRGAMFLGKLIGNLLLVLIVVAASVFAFVIFLNQPFPDSPGLLAAVLLMGSWGFVATGVFLASLASSSSISELLMPIMLFPLSVPLLLAITQLSEMALYPSPANGMALWLSLLFVYDIVFTFVPLLLFDLLLEV